MLKNKVFIITGGARGIGFEIYRSCIQEGAFAVICSRSKEEIDEAIKKVDPLTLRTIGIKADVSVIADVKKLIGTTVKQFGSIDVLVNNAGIYGPIGPFETNTIHEWAQTMSVNLSGTVNCCKIVLPIMKKNKSGKIINLAGAGIGGSKPLARFSAYYTSKMAIAGFTEVLGAEVVDDNIQINCISPGAVNTKFTDILLENGIEKVGKSMYEQTIKQKESGGDDPALAAKMVMFLASTKADHVNGKIISCKWDSIKKLSNKDYVKNNLYNLRRIDNTFFYEK